MFATCSFADYTDRDGHLAVRSSVGAPRGGKLRFAPYAVTLLPVLGAVVPESRWVSEARAGTLSQVDYFTRYSAMIRDRVQQIRKQATAIRKAAKVKPSTRLVLLCFCHLENQGEWCHRTCFAQTWAELTGEEVPELGRVRIPEIAADQPPTLF